MIFVSAALLSLPYHLPAAWFTAFFAFIPIFFTFEKKTSSQIFKICFIFGLFYHASLGYWLNYVNVLGFLLLSGYLSIYFGFFGSLSRHFFVQNNLRSTWYVAGIWVMLEYARGFLFGGFPWALLGYSQWKNLPFIQIADVIGAYGVSFFVIWVNLILYRILRGVRVTRYLTALCLVLVIVVGYGVERLHSWDKFYRAETPKATLRISVIQGNIPQDQKWDAKIKEIIFEKYNRLSMMASMEQPELIVWPETSFPGYFENEPMMASHLRSVVRQAKTRLLVGAPMMSDFENGLVFYNGAILFSSNGEEAGRYSKMHLVPFGEYIPFEALLGFIRYFVEIGRFSPGADPTIFSIVSEYQKIKIAAKFGVLICYEDIFPSMVRNLCRNGADFLVNITNDAWFGKTSAPYQHAQASVFRAIENRVPVVRAANTGLSCFISAEGRVTASVQKDGEEIMVSGHQTHDITLRKGRSFFTRFGDIFFWLVLGILFFAFKEKHKNSGYSRL